MIILKSKLLNKKSIPPACEYCSRGSCAPDGKTVLCPKKGVMHEKFELFRVSIRPTQAQA